MKPLLLFIVLLCSFSLAANADYDRNKAVPVEKVLFGQIISVRNITKTELIQDQNHGWKVFGGALIGGALGNQFGKGSGRVATTVLGALLGSNISNDRNPEYRQKTINLVELMIKTDQGQEYMVVQDYDTRMVFVRQDPVRMIYLANGSVRIDKQM